MLLGFIPLATLAGWFPARLGFYLSLIVEFTLVYVIIWLVSHHFYKTSPRNQSALLNYDSGKRRKRELAILLKSSLRYVFNLKR